MNDAPDEKLSAPNRCTKIVFGPSELIELRSDVSKPRISDVMPTIEVTPITTPSTVSAERILLLRSVSNAIAAVSPSSANCFVNGDIGLSPRRKRFDRIEHRRAARRHPAEEQADRGGDGHAERHRPESRPTTAPASATR